ncbi:MAG: threonine transporter, partial [Aquamicrobium sp.]|nr:threonine transporter [Aquamicrobium sp.]
MSFVSFVIAAIMVLITPGPTNTILAASGAAMGWRRAMVLPVAEAAGYLVAVTAYLVLVQSFADVAAAMP